MRAQPAKTPTRRSCVALSVNYLKTQYWTNMGQEDLMSTAEDVADQVTSILARQLLPLAAVSMLSAN